MDSFELNKIIGAILGTLLFVMGVGFLAEAIYEPAHGSGPGYSLPEAVSETASTEGTAPAAPVDIGTLLASADAKAGAASAKKCQACHDFTKGGPNKTGPVLYGIVDEKIADVPGFNFSDALKAHASETWTYENLDKWLLSPKTFAPGTKMSFAGITNDKERADVIAYLSTLSDSPVPFPAPAAAAASESSAAPAASEAPASSEPAAAPAASSEAPAAAPASSEPAAAPASSEAPAASSSEPAPAASSSAAPAASSEAPASSESSSAAQ